MPLAPRQKTGGLPGSIGPYGELAQRVYIVDGCRKVSHRPFSRIMRTVQVLNLD